MTTVDRFPGGCKEDFFSGVRKDWRRGLGGAGRPGGRARQMEKNPASPAAAVGHHETHPMLRQRDPSTVNPSPRGDRTNDKRRPEPTFCRTAQLCPGRTFRLDLHVDRRTP